MAPNSDPERLHDDFRSCHARDLAWAILSPSLIQPSLSGMDDHFFIHIYTLIRKAIQQQDVLAQGEFTSDSFPPVTPGFRLGLYFERCWHQILSLHPSLRILEHNLPLRDATRTLGEFDLILQNDIEKQQEHWELTLKYYLGVPLANGETCWLGPSQHDQLERKYRHLVQHQLPLSRTEAAQVLFAARGWDILQRRILSKGVLFYPSAMESRLQGYCATVPDYVHPLHERGIWLTASTFRQWSEQRPPIKAIHLPKTRWMALPSFQNGQPHDLLQDLHTIETRLPHGFRFPVQMLVVSNEPGPFIRYFVVPDDWLESAVSGRFPG